MGGCEVGTVGSMIQQIYISSTGSHNTPIYVHWHYQQKLSLSIDQNVWPRKLSDD